MMTVRLAAVSKATNRLEILTLKYKQTVFRQWGLRPYSNVADPTFASGSQESKGHIEADIHLEPAKTVAQ